MARQRRSVIKVKCRSRLRYKSMTELMMSVVILFTQAPSWNLTSTFEFAVKPAA